MSSAYEAPPLEVVYLLGNSFSGSTLLGFLMAGSPDVLCLGELKMHNRIGSRICSCGAPGTDCPFWSSWDAEGYQLYSGSRWAQVKLIGRLLLALPVSARPDHPAPNDDLRFLRRISAESGGPRYLLDTSKSLWRLAHLSRTPGIDLTVIHVRRQLHGTIASFVRRFDKFWHPLARCLLNNFLCRRFLALHPEVRHISVHHEDLCNDPDAVMTRIGAFLGVEYAGYMQYLETVELHVRGGNERTIAASQHGVRVRSAKEEEERWRGLLQPRRLRLLDWLAPREMRQRRHGVGRTPGRAMAETRSRI